MQNRIFLRKISYSGSWGFNDKNTVNVWCVIFFQNDQNYLVTFILDCKSFNGGKLSENLHVIFVVVVDPGDVVCVWSRHSH